MRFGDWVYEQLEKHERSVNWLAKKVGCSHSAFLDYKKTDREVSTRVLMETIKVLAEVSGKSEERVLLYVARHCYGVGE
jgi:ACT domain-containing protein